MRTRVVLVPGLLALTLAVMAFRIRFELDDAFISFRYAVNLVGGLGLVMNAGERVEGYTCPAWVLLLAALHRLGADLPAAAHVLGIAASTLTVLASGVVAARMARVAPALAAACAAALVALLPATVYWTASAMETPAFMLFVLLGVAAGTGGSRPAGAGLLCGCAAIMRPEGALFGLAAALDVWWRRGAGAAARFVAGFIPLPLALEVFRLVYYRVPLPNTFYAKSGFEIAHGLWYVTQFVRHGGWIFALAPAALFGRHRAVVATWLTVTCAYGAWVVAIGGDGFAFQRFIVPVVPVLAISFAIGVDTIVARAPRLAALAMLLVAGWVVSLRADYRTVVADARAVEVMTDGFRVVGTRLGAVAPRGTRIALISVGALPFYAGPGIEVVDMLGLTDAHIARAGERVPDGLPGHNRFDNAYVLARRPDLILVPPPRELPPCARPLTARAVREDPCGTAFLVFLGGEVALPAGGCPHVPDACPYALPVRIAFDRPDIRARLAADYDRVRELPGVGALDVFRRRGWPG